MGSCEHLEEPSGSVPCGECLAKQILKEDPASWSVYKGYGHVGPGASPHCGNVI
jgi:hypothetical protein